MKANSQMKCATDLIPNNLSYNTPQVEINTSSRSAKFEIPIVFHIFTLDGEDPLQTFDIYDQIDALNTYYNRALHASILYSEASPFVENPKITFCLATIDPDEKVTTGILYYDTDDSSLGNLNLQGEVGKVKQESLGGANAWNTDRYLNIWVAPRNDGILGDATFPGTGSKEEDGIVIKTSVLGTKQGLGKTLVHEIGHYLGLKHPWGSSGACSDDDGIKDTPFQEGGYFGCPSYPQQSCGSLDFIYNFMDFHDDDCLLFFTKGQVDVMHEVLKTSRSELTMNGCHTQKEILSFNDLISFYNGTHIVIYSRSYASFTMNVKLYDISGKKIYDSRSNKDFVFRINSDALKAGIYILSLENDSSFETRKIFVSSN
ncbi:MAG: zinc-dependent metalloprotease [Saprospiraceae bacterium]